MRPRNFMTRPRPDRRAVTQAHCDLIAMERRTATTSGSPTQAGCNAGISLTRAYGERFL